MKEVDEKLPGGWRFNKLRGELYCHHGVGHPVPWVEKSVHGCCRDQCCDPDNEESKWKEALETLIDYYNLDLER